MAPSTHPHSRRMHRVHHGSGTSEWMLTLERSTALSQLGMYGIGVTSAGPELDISSNDQAGALLVVSLDGNGSAKLDGVWQTLPAGNWYFCPHGSDSAYRSAGAPWRLAWFAWSGIAGPAAGHLTTTSFAHPTRLLGELLQAAQTADSLNDATILEALLPAINALCRRACGEEPSDLDRVWTVVQQDAAQHWTLSDLARIAGCSPETLRRICLRISGRSPMHHVTVLRMRQAAGMIARGATIKNAAATVGYENAGSFSRAFHRILGRPPASLRASRQRTHAPGQGSG